MSSPTVTTENVSDILERELPAMIKDWLGRVELEPDLAHVPLTFEGYPVPELTKQIIVRDLSSSGVPDVTTS